MTRLVPLLAVLAACGDGKPSAPSAAKPRLAPAPAATPAPATFAVSGSVIDRDTREPVPGVEVVLRGEHGDVATRTASDGAFKVAVAPGSYRAFVRDATWLSTGMQGRIRLRTLPRAELAGVADDKLMPLLEVDGETAGVELTVTAGAVIDATVFDPDGNLARDVVVQAVPLERPFVRSTTPSVAAPIVRRIAPRPVLGTDIAISDDMGKVRLRVPAGSYELVANHAKFAGIGGLAEVDVDRGTRFETKLTLVRGCVISGKITTADGSPPHDGALETRSAITGEFLPTGRVDTDGTFRWTTVENQLVSIRAWPWRQPPSPAQTFECRDGKTYTNVVLALPNALSDIAGTISDAHGNPVPLAYIDISPIDVGEHGQQERADASGRWDVFEMRAGRYQITAAAAGRGIAIETITAPRRDVALRLSGTGRISGTTTELVDGSFELTFHHCGPSTEAVEVDDDARIVVVRGGRFVVDRVPACTLTFTARWRDKLVTQAVVVEPDRATYVELGLGAPRDKDVHGTVRDDSGKPIANALVTAVVDNREVTSVRTNADGKFTIKAAFGAELVATNGRRSGRASVGRANVPTEQVDIALSASHDSY